jgi:DNA replication protein DnaC
LASSRSPRQGPSYSSKSSSQRYERGSIIITSNLPFDEWTEVFGSERLTGAILDRLTHHVHILEMNGDSFRLRESRKTKA